MEARKEDLDEILEALSYGTFDENDEADFYSIVVQPFSEKYKKPFDYATGATKGVLIFEQLGFVIKIPFCCNSEDCEYNSAYGEYECCYFTGADTDNGWDYCEAEANKYERAKEEGLAQCFAKTKKIGDIDGYPIYMQELADIYKSIDYQSSHTEEDSRQVSSICNSNNFYMFNIEWLSDAFHYYGEKMFHKLLEFIRTLGINDLHDGNIGYIGNRPVLVDYSSFDS
jgi:hypothetical protein